MSRAAEIARHRVRDAGYLHLPRLASWLRKRWVVLRNPHAAIEFGRHVYLGPRFSLHLPHGGTVIVGDGVEFRRNFRAELGDGGRLVIGAGTRFAYDVVIQCGTTIEIGERCIFAHAVTIVDGSHRFRDPATPVLEQGYEFRPVRIADDAAVMAKATVIADVGRHAFVGANAVVSRPVPDFSLAVGIPARPIDYFGPPGEGASGPEGSSSATSGATGPSDGGADSASSQASRKSGASS